MNSFSRTVDMLHRAMDVSTLRFQVTANNLANAGVPDFKRSSVTFESELQKAIESEKATQGVLKMQTSESCHYEGQKPIDYTTVKPRRVVDFQSVSNSNGNNVDAEQEAMESLKIQLNYQLLSSLENFQFTQVRTVIK